MNARAIAFYSAGTILLIAALVGAWRHNQDVVDAVEADEARGRTVQGMPRQDGGRSPDALR